MTLQDFSTIRTYVNSYKDDYKQQDEVDAFYYLGLELILGIPDDEIADSITDNNYLVKQKTGKGGHDRGIDAVYIDESDTSRPIVHFFNFKHTSKYEKAQEFIQSGEIEKILSFLSAMFDKDANLIHNINPVLFGKVQEIWDIFESINPAFVFHICTNHFQSFEPNEKARFEREIQRRNFFTIEYHLANNFVDILTQRAKQIIDARIRAIDKNYFEITSGKIKALIVHIDAKDLIRITLDDESIRQQADLTDYKQMTQFEVFEDAFEDNVRIYLRQKSSINQGIKLTALSDESSFFFFFNNGITITCSQYAFNPGQRSPIIELKDVQIVNGCQTIYALHEAFKENSDSFERIEILCRIYATNDADLSMKIAEYTNSQNPIKSRDIRSIDSIQRKLEAEFAAINYYYERKKNQHQGQPKSLRLDAEKAGQALIAMYNRLPADAKQNRYAIFGDKYDTIFDDKVNADKVLLAYKLFDQIELEKRQAKAILIQQYNPDTYNIESFIIYASYFILFLLGELAKQNNISLTYDHFDQIWNLYPEAVEVTRELVESERQKSPQQYSITGFFKSNRLVKAFDDRSDDAQ